MHRPCKVICNRARARVSFAVRRGSWLVQPRWPSPPDSDRSEPSARSASAEPERSAPVKIYSVYSKQARDVLSRFVCARGTVFRRTERCNISGDFVPVLRLLKTSANGINPQLVRDRLTNPKGFRVLKFGREISRQEIRIGEIANCEFGIIRARDPFLTSSLSFFLSFSILPSSPRSLSIFLRFFLKIPSFSPLYSLTLLLSLYPFSISSFLFRTLPPVIFSLLYVLFLLSPLRTDIVSWGQCLLDRILSRNTHLRRRTISLVARLRITHARPPRTQATHRSNRNRKKER